MARDATKDSEGFKVRGTLWLDAEVSVSASNPSRIIEKNKLYGLNQFIMCIEKWHFPHVRRIRGAGGKGGEGERKGEEQREDENEERKESKEDRWKDIEL